MLRAQHLAAARHTSDRGREDTHRIGHCDRRVMVRGEDHAPFDRPAGGRDVDGTLGTQYRVAVPVAPVEGVHGEQRPDHVEHLATGVNVVPARPTRMRLIIALLPLPKVLRQRIARRAAPSWRGSRTLAARRPGARVPPDRAGSPAGGPPSSRRRRPPSAAGAGWPQCQRRAEELRLSRVGSHHRVHAIPRTVRNRQQTLIASRHPDNYRL